MPVGLLALALLLALAGPAAAVEKSRKPPPKVTAAASPVVTGPEGWGALAALARKGVVHIRGALGPTGAAARGAAGGAVSVGSGFVVDAAGHIVTNEHVVRGTADIRVRFADGRELPACVVGADEPTDIALLKVEAGESLDILPLGDSDALRVGDAAVAIGSPFGFSHSVTAGIVSAKERVIPRPDESPNANKPGIEGYSFFIQTDASINLGNSGGPLLDAHGAVIGVNAAFWGGTQPAHGIGFAIPVNIVKALLPRLRDEGEAPRSFLGVESQPLTSAVARALGLSALRGALLAHVEPGSAAELAGLAPGDLVVTWAGRPIAADEDLKIYAQLTPPGSRVRVGLRRAGSVNDAIEERLLTTRALGGRTARVIHPAGCRPLTAAPMPEGFDAADLSPGRAIGLPGGRGVEISHVQGGAAREADLQAGDIVLRAGRVAVGSVQELRRALGEAPADRPVPLLVRRQGRHFWAALPRR